MSFVRPFTNLPPLRRDEQNNNYASYAWIKGFLSDSEVSKVLTLWDDKKAHAAKLYNSKGDAASNEDIQKAKQLFINPEEQGWIYDKLAMACIMTNMNRYKFNISGFLGELRIMQYEPGDFFEWHSDYGTADVSMRKLVISVQLSDDDDYVGGDLQFLNDESDSEKNGLRKKGTIVIFPSFVVHRVLSITSGSRKALVGIIGGPPFI